MLMKRKDQAERPVLPEPQKLTPEALERLGEEFRAWSAALETRTQAMEVLTSQDLRARAK
jgi:hypothetical protein